MRDSTISRATVLKPAFRDDDVGVALGRFDELHVHGAHGVQVLLDDRFGGAPALDDVALQAANEAQVGVGVDEDLDVEELRRSAS